MKTSKFGSRIEYHFQETGQLVEAFLKSQLYTETGN